MTAHTVTQLFFLFLQKGQGTTINIRLGSKKHNQ